MASAIPPLPEPGESSPEDRVAMSRRFIQQARKEHQEGDRTQAGEKAWGAIAQLVKAIGHTRGWDHRSHKQVEDIGRHLVKEYDDARIGTGLADAYFRGHKNFYENTETDEEIEVAIESVEVALPLLENILAGPRAPSQSRPGATSGAWSRITGKDADEFAIGETSPVGFSNTHAPPV